MPRRLLLLNGLAILAAVLFHAEGWSFVATFAWAHRYLPAGAAAAQQAETAGYYALRAVEQLVTFAIPSFLFVSGFFVAFSAGRNQRMIEWKTVRSRVKYVMIPYVFWSVLVWIALWLEGKHLSPLGYLERLLTGSTNPAYYYVPLLVQLYLLAPVIVFLARTHARALLITTGLLQLAVHALQYPSLLHVGPVALQQEVLLVPKWLFLARLFWFCCGVVAGFQLPALKRWLERYRWAALTSVLLLFVAGVIEWEWLGRMAGQPDLPMRETVVDALYAGAFILAFLAFGDLRPPVSETLNVLASKSFGIYLVHSPVMEYLARGLYHLAPRLLGYPFLLVPLLVAAGLGVPLLLMLLVRRSPARPLYAYQFG